MAQKKAITITWSGSKTSPYSNFETGVKKNGSNVLATIISTIVALGGIIFVPIWWGWGAFWAFYLSIAVIQILYYLGMRSHAAEHTNINLDDGYTSDIFDEYMNWEQIWLFMLLWPFQLWHLFWGQKWKELKNRYVYRKGRTYIFSREWDQVRELKIYNPVVYLWVMFFRAGDDYDQHSKVVDAAIEVKRKNDMAFLTKGTEETDIGDETVHEEVEITLDADEVFGT